MSLAILCTCMGSWFRVRAKAIPAGQRQRGIPFTSSSSGKGRKSDHRPTPLSRDRRGTHNVRESEVYDDHFARFLTPVAARLARRDQ